MSVSGIGGPVAPLLQALQAQENRLNTLQTQLGTGNVSTDYAGLGPDRGLAVSLQNQLSLNTGYADTITNVGVRINVASNALSNISSVASTVQSAAQTSTFTIDDTGQTVPQESANSQLSEVLSLLNSQAGDRYVFSGRATNQPSTASLDEIMNGDAAHAGFKTVMAQRLQADLGSNGLGRLEIPSATTTPASLTGTGATITADAPAIATGTNNLGGGYTSGGGTLKINGVNVTIPSGSNIGSILSAINAPGVVAQTGVTATAPGGKLTLTSANATTAVDLTGSTGSLINEFGIAVGPTQPNNLLTQNPAPVTAGQTLTVAIGSNPPTTITFGTGAGQVSTQAQLNAALGTLAGGTASVNASGNITVTASNPSDAITVGGTADPTKFGLSTTVAVPSTAPASLTGTGATIASDVDATVTGNQNLTAPYVSGGGTLAINGVDITVNPGDSISSILSEINAPSVVAQTGVTATAPGGYLTLTGTTAASAIGLSGTDPALLGEFGLNTGPTEPTNLLTQTPAPVTAGQTLTVTVGSNPPTTITFGTDQTTTPPQVSTLAQLNAQLGAIAGATASVGASGNISITANNTTDAITVGGTAGLTKFGLSATSALPSNVVGLSEQSPPTVFGFKLGSISTTSSSISVTGPTSTSPALVTADFQKQPAAGDQVSIGLNLPDGTSDTIRLTATTSNPPGANQYLIGSSLAATTANFQAALNTAVGTEASTSLTAASAQAAANDFFDGQPPMRVAGPPYDTATAQVAGTSANTVYWYTGESGTGPAIGTAVAQVGNSLTVSYGARANEQSLTNVIKNLAIFSSMTYSASDPNAQARYADVNQRVATNLAGTNGQQQISDIEAQLAYAQSTMTSAQQSQQQQSTTLTNVLQGIEQADPNTVATELLAMQTQMQASLSATAMLSKISILNYLAPA
jgi:flagellar hook-associated protein 3 FlgL